MRLLTAAFMSSAEFLSHYSSKHPDGALFFRSRTELSIEEPVLIEISFAGLPNRALVRGAVLSLEAGKGAWLKFDRADSSTREFLVRLAREELEVTEKVERSHNRFPASLPVAIQIEDRSERASGSLAVSETKTTDISASGVFIQSEAPPPIGTQLKLMIDATDDTGDTFILQGEVTWVRNDADAQGFGVKFKKPSTDDNRRFRTLLRRASESGRVKFTNA